MCVVVPLSAVISALDILRSFGPTSLYAMDVQAAVRGAEGTHVECRRNEERGKKGG